MFETNRIVERYPACMHSVELKVKALLDRQVFKTQNSEQSESGGAMLKTHVSHNRLMRKIFTLTVDFPHLFIFGTLALTLFFALQLPKLRIETDLGVYLAEDHPSVLYQDLVEEVFNYQDSMVVALFNDGPHGIFNPQTLAKVQRLTKEIADIPYVKAQREEDVKSISTMDNIIGTEDGIEVTPLMEKVPATQEEINLLREAIYGNEMFPGWIVSEDGTAAVILAEIDYNENNESLAYQEIKKIVEREQGGGDRIYVAGQPVLEATFVHYIVRNLQVMLPIVIGIITVLLYLTFGSLRGVVLPLMVVVASVIWSMGIMSMVGVPFYDITTVTPVTLVAIGSAYGIHILNRYYEEVRERPGRNKKEIVLQSMLSIWQPVLMSSLTTAVGFASLCTSSLIPIFGFGIFTAAGILCALLFSLAFIPAGLMLVRIPAMSQTPGRRIDVGRIVQKYSDAVLALTGNWVYGQRRKICLAGALVAVVALVGFMRVRVNDSWLEMFDHDGEVYRSNKLIDEKLNGTVSLNVVIEGDEVDAIKSPSLLRKIDGLQKLAEEEAEVGGTISIADYLKRMNKVMNEDKEEFNTIPDSTEAVAQYLLLYSLSGDPEDFDEVVDYDYRQANITIMLKDDHTASIKKIADRLKQYMADQFQDEPVDVNLTGYAYQTQVIIDLAVRGMLSSIVLSIVFIYIMTSLMFRSFTGGLYNIIPITMAMLLNFGLMGMLGVTIGFANSVAFAVAMGVGVDYAIHLVFKFQREVARNSDLRDVNTITLMTSGRAILFNAAVVTAGFIVLLASSFTAHADLGWLLSLSMITSFLGSMTLLPAALNLFQPAFAFPKRMECPGRFFEVACPETIGVAADEGGELNE
jgi:predicted RND superfamily exporter protein